MVNASILVAPGKIALIIAITLLSICKVRAQSDQIIARSSYISIAACYTLHAKLASSPTIRYKRGSQKILRPKRVRVRLAGACSSGSNPPSSSTPPTPTRTPTRTPTPTSTPTVIPTPRVDSVGGPASDHIAIKIKAGLTLDSASCVQDKISQSNVIAALPFYDTPEDPTVFEALGLNRVFLLQFQSRQGPQILNIISSFRSCSSELDWAVLDLSGEAVHAETVTDVVSSGDVVAGGTSLPNDPRFGEQWALNNIGQAIPNLPPTSITPAPDINFPEAWQLHPHINWDDAIVAVIDTGVDPHPEFANRLLPGANTYVMSLNSQPQNPNLTQDNVGHGTAVAGVIASKGNDGSGIAGVSWGARILPIKVTAEQDDPSTTDKNETIHPNIFSVAKGISKAVDMGANVLNLSLGVCETVNTFCTENLVFLHDAVRYATAMDAVCVAASGNSERQMAYPANFPECLAVAATNNNDLRYLSGGGLGSGMGSEMDLSAPGVAILTTATNPDHIYNLSNAGYVTKSGTSMATAFVSGTAALIRTMNPDVSGAQVVANIKSSVDQLGYYWFGQWQSQPVDQYGLGRLNAYRALQATAYSRLVALGSEFGDNSYSYAVNINNRGSVVGYTAPPSDLINNPLIGWLYSKGRLRTLTASALEAAYPEVQAIDITENQDVLISTHDDWLPPHLAKAYIVRNAGSTWKLLDQLPLPSQATSIEAKAMNNSKKVVGYILMNGQRAFLYDGTMHDIHALLPTTTMSIALDINDHDLILGSYNGGAFIYNAQSTAITLLPNIAGLPLAINNASQIEEVKIVGKASNTTQVAVIWEWNSAVSSFEAVQLPSPCNFAEASAINNNDEIVGNIICNGVMEGVLWRREQGNWTLQRLNDLLTPEHLAAGWRLQKASAINARGQVTGTMETPLGYRGYRLDFD